MSQTDGISWTDATWNVVGGCSRASRGCQRCYAERLAGTRLRNHPLYRDTVTKTSSGYTFNGHLTVAAADASVWGWPGKWNGSSAPRLGLDAPSLIFVGDMSDLFHEARPRGHIVRVLETIRDAVLLSGRRHIFQLLTKRPEVMLEVFKIAGVSEWMPRHLWLGFSAEDQENFDARWPHARELARLGFTVFCSYEPALGPLILPADFLELGPRAWLIAGGESGRDPRPCHLPWLGAVVAQCVAANVPVFVKQIGAHPVYFDGSTEKPTFCSKGSDMIEFPRDLRVRQFPEVAA